MTHRILFGLVLVTLLGLELSMIHFGARPAVTRHILFAVGVMPLILGAMLYFVPVLTRTAVARGAILGAPLTALALGIAVVLMLDRQPQVLPFLAALGLAVVALELVWIRRRLNMTLGRAHPGSYWYVFALASLLLALTAILSQAYWPMHWPVLRLFHLHLNLFGFLGLTAIGTLRVLLPTALRRVDESAFTYLRSQLPFALAGSLAIAIGAALWLPLAYLGGLLWLVPALSLCRVVVQRAGECVAADNASTALAAAAVGWLLVLCAGFAHGGGILAADSLFGLFVFLFLLPLLTGATSYLLPIWRWPGRQTAAHSRMRTLLTRLTRMRVLAFWLSAVLVLYGMEAAAVPALIALAAYLLQVIHALARVRAEAAV